MKKLITPILKYGINKAKRSKFIQNIFEAPFDLSKFPIKGTFTDSKGNTFQLLDGLRSRIKPGWQKALSDKPAYVAQDQLGTFKEHGELSVKKIEPLIKSMGVNIAGAEILEVGCHSGAVSFALADLGAKHVTGSEFSGYKVEALDQEGVEESTLSEVNQELKELRNDLKKLYSKGENVSFADDDICNTTLPKEAFDIVCSFEVLEHLHDTEKAFESITGLLKKGGIMVHEYNPFFCLNGGHSLCTLDFLWGHVRLNDVDFQKYLREIRPEEKDRAYSFYKKGLNRTTLKDLHDQLEKSGMEVFSILPFTKEQHVRMADDEILAQGQKNYTNLTLQDLVTPRVFVMARKV